MLERICLVAALLGIAALFGAMTVTVADIVLRPLGGVVPGIVDLVQLMIMAAAFLTIPYAFVSDAHVSVDFLADQLSDRLVSVLRLAAALLATVLLALLVRYGWDSALQQIRFGDRSHTIGIPLLWYWIPLLTGLALSVVTTLFLAARELVRIAVGRDPVTGSTAV